MSCPYEDGRMPQIIRKLLVVALRPEWSFLKQKYSFVQDKQLKNLYHISSHPGAALLQIGVGKEFAEKSFSELLKQRTVASVLHFGTAGALVPELKTGDVVLVTEIVCKDLSVGADPCVRPSIEIHLGQTHGFAPTKNEHIIPGKHLTVQAPLVSKEQKEKAHAQTGAIAVDMESYFVARICRDKGISYCSVRGIFDRMTDDIEGLDVIVGNEGCSKVNVFKHPKLILKIPMLKKKMGLVNRAMGNVVEIILST